IPRRARHSSASSPDSRSARLGLRRVGARGFDPPTSWYRTRRANRAALRPEARKLEADKTEGKPRAYRCSAMLDEAAVLQLGVGVPQLRLRVHHDRPGPSHRLLERPSRDDQKPDSGFARLHGDLVARIEQHERAITGVLTYGGPRHSLPHALGQHAARCRGVAERAASLEHVGEGVARGLHGQRLLNPRRDTYVKVPGVALDALVGTGMDL